MLARAPNFGFGPGGRVGYRYDASQRMVGVQDPDGASMSMTYDAADQLVALRRPNGVDDALTHRGGAVLTRDASRGGQVLGRADSTFDAIGRRTSLSDVDGTHTLTLDPGNRLTGADHPAASGVADNSCT